MNVFAPDRGRQTVHCPVGAFNSFFHRTERYYSNLKWSLVIIRVYLTHYYYPHIHSLHCQLCHPLIANIAIDYNSHNLIQYKNSHHSFTRTFTVALVTIRLKVNPLCALIALVVTMDYFSCCVFYTVSTCEERFIRQGW